MYLNYSLSENEIAVDSEKARETLSHLFTQYLMAPVLFNCRVSQWRSQGFGKEGDTSAFSIKKSLRVKVKQFSAIFTYSVPIILPIPPSPTPKKLLIGFAQIPQLAAVRK